MADTVNAKSGGGPERKTRWGGANAFFDDDAAKDRLLAAAERCIVKRGNAGIRIEEVAAEAGVVRSTVYRYFGNREALLTGVMAARVDLAMGKMVDGLSRPGDATRSITDLILRAVELIHQDAVNSALLEPSSIGLVGALEGTSDEVINVIISYLEPLVSAWQADGQVYRDLDPKVTVRWMNGVVLMLMISPWAEMNAKAMRRFVDRYVTRAIVVPRPSAAD